MNFLLPYWPQRTRLKFHLSFSFTETHIVVLYCSRSKNKNVFLMGTHHSDDAVKTRESRRPKTVLHYKRNKGGVDNLDKVCCFLSLNSVLVFQLSDVFMHTKE